MVKNTSDLPNGLNNLVKCWCLVRNTNIIIVTGRIFQLLLLVTGTISAKGINFPNSDTLGGLDFV